MSNLRGDREMQRALSQLALKFQQEAAQALQVEAELIRTDAIRNNVPKDLGTLANSIVVESPVVTKSDISVKIAAGGAAAPYALAIHEHPSPHSPPSWQGKPISGISSVRTGEPWSLDGRGPKFIERPMKKRAPGAMKRIAEKLNRIAGK